MSTYYVSPSGNDTNVGTNSNPFLTISHAITTANNGDTIYISSGTYNYGSTTSNNVLNINKPLTIVGRQTTTDSRPIINISTASNNTAVLCNASNITLQGLEIVHNPASTGWNDTCINISPGGTPIYPDSGLMINENIKILDCKIYFTKFGVSSKAKSFSVKNCEVVSKVLTTARSIAIYSQDGVVDITDNIFTSSVNNNGIELLHNNFATNDSYQNKRNGTVNFIGNKTIDINISRRAIFFEAGSDAGITEDSYSFNVSNNTISTTSDCMFLLQPSNPNFLNFINQIKINNNNFINNPSGSNNGLVRIASFVPNGGPLTPPIKKPKFSVYSNTINNSELKLSTAAYNVDNKGIVILTGFNDNGTGGLDTNILDSILINSEPMIHVSPSGNDTSGDGSLSSPFLTLNKALSSAADGDIIYFLQGQYTLTNFTINKSVTLLGPNKDIEGVSDNRNPEAILFNSKITIADGKTVTINGIKFLQTNDVSDLLTIPSNTIVRNCIFERNGINAGVVARSIVMYASSSNQLIEHNLFTGSTEGDLFREHKTWSNGIFKTGGALNNPTSGKIQNNVFRNCRSALNLDNNNRDVEVINNKFENCGTYIALGGNYLIQTSAIFKNNIFRIDGPATLVNNSYVNDNLRVDIIDNIFEFNENNMVTQYLSSQLSLAQKILIESRMFHKGRSNRNGVVYYSLNEQVVVNNQTTISKALSYAHDGETIFLTQGTYGTSNVTTITINKSVKIFGPNKDISYKSVRNTESHLLNHKFDILANNVEINGLHVTGPNMGGQTVFGGVNTTFSNLIVTNTVIEDVNGMCLYYQGSGIRDGITFSQCKISGFGNGTDGRGTSSAFNPWNCTNVNIDNCLIENVDFNGINLESVENATITNNIIKNIGKSGIQLANNCKGNFVIKNNEFSQVNCRYYGWGKINTRNNVVNPVAPRTINMTSEPDWQFYYAAIKWFSNQNPLVHSGDYTIEDNKFNNCWCGYQFARELPNTNGPQISFKNNYFTNNTHGDVMIYRSNTTNTLYNLRDNGLEDASIKVFNWTTPVSDGMDTLEKWTTTLNRGTSHTIVLDKTSPALVQVQTGKLVVVQNMSINSVLSKAVENDVIDIAPATYNEKVIINKSSISLLGVDKETTVISSEQPIQLIQGSSQTSIRNISIRGKFSSTENMYLVNDSNNTYSGINVYTEGNIDVSINNIVIDNVSISRCANGINFNNPSSKDISISNCVIEDNAGAGIRISSNVTTMNGLSIDKCIIRENNLNAITSNPSGSYRPNCTNYVIKNTQIHRNNRLTANNAHDISMFGFNGDLEMSEVDIICNHADSKTINKTSSSSGGWGLIIYGSNQSSILRQSGNIKLNNVIIQGTVVKSVLGIDRYSSFSEGVLFNNVDVQNCKAGWNIQVIIGNNSTILDIGTMKLRTISLSSVGDLDARRVSFYHVETGQVLNKNNQNDLLQIEKQIIDRFDNNNIGKIIFTVNVFISSKEPSAIENALGLYNTSEMNQDKSSSINQINLLSGDYKTKVPIMFNNISNVPVLMNTVTNDNRITQIILDDAELQFWKPGTFTPPWRRKPAAFPPGI